MDTADLRNRMIAASVASGLSVRTTMQGRSSDQHFATEAARDEYMARATRCGATVETIKA
jgi:hypothetical protein